MIKIAAIAGLIIAGITITIFMGQGGPCDDQVKEIPPFSSSRGEGFGLDRSFGVGSLDWVKDIKCGFFKPSRSPQQIETSSPSASLAPAVPPSSTEVSDGGKKRLKAVFAFWDNPARNYGNVNGSLRKSFKIEIANNGTNENLFDWLPMQIVLKADNKRAWENYITKESCNEDLRRQYCNVPFYKYNSAWDGKKLLMQLYDNKGELLEIHYEE